MIPRYSRPEMTRIWEPETRYRIWFEIEAHACDAQAELGVIPKAAAEAVWQRGAFEVARIEEIERETRHDVIAFLWTGCWPPSRPGPWSTSTPSAWAAATPSTPSPPPSD
jgi:hypothetical protein